MGELDTKEKTTREWLQDYMDSKTNAFEEKSKGFASMSDVDAKLKEFADKMKPKELAPTTDEAEMEEGMLANIAKTEVFGVEFGKIAIGTFGAVFTSEIIDGFLAAQTSMIKGGTKLFLAGIVAKWGKRWVGDAPAKAIALILGVFGLSQVLPVDKWAVRAASSIRSMLPGTIKVDMAGDALEQANVVANRYSQGIFGRKG